MGALADEAGLPNQHKMRKLVGGEYRKGPRGNAQQTWGRARPKVRFRKDLKPVARHPAPQGTIRTCNAPRRADGAPCLQPAGVGTKHKGFGRCGQHGGNTERGIRLAAIEEAAANTLNAEVEKQGGLEFENAVTQLYGIIAEITPDKALEAELWRTNGAVLQIEDALSAIGSPAELELLPHGRVLSSLYREERDRLVKISKIMIDIGFQERQITASEVVAGTLQAVILDVLNALELTPEQSAHAPQIVRRILEIEAARLDPNIAIENVVSHQQFVDEDEPIVVAAREVPDNDEA